MEWRDSLASDKCEPRREVRSYRAGYVGCASGSEADFVISGVCEESGSGPDDRRKRQGVRTWRGRPVRWWLVVVGAESAGTGRRGAYKTLPSRHR